MLPFMKAVIADVPSKAPVARVRARGAGWRVSEVLCTLGPHDRPFEERHESVSIAAVLSGTFRYRSPAGSALLYPGAFMLGNAGACFECGHEHGVGDRCLAFHFEPGYFEEIAAGVTGSHRFRFAAGMLPALRPMAAPLAKAQTPLARTDALAAEEAAVGLAEAALENQAGAAVGPAPTARDQRRLSAVLRYIEEHSREALDLDRLAAIASMSKYHFLRTFRRSLGLTPYQFLLGHRLSRAAAALRASDASVAAVAFDQGFGDLSGFNTHFHRTFGMSPGEFRRSI